MKKQKLIKVTASMDLPVGSVGTAVPAGYNGEMAIIFEGKDLGLYGFDGSSWSLIHRYQVGDNHYVHSGGMERYYVMSFTGQNEEAKLSFFTSNQISNSIPRISSTLEETKLQDINEVPPYTAGDQNKMLTVLSDGSLAWLLANQNYVVDENGNYGETITIPEVIDYTSVYLESYSSNIVAGTNGAVDADGVFSTKSNPSLSGTGYYRFYNPGPGLINQRNLAQPYPLSAIQNWNLTGPQYNTDYQLISGTAGQTNAVYGLTISTWLKNDGLGNMGLIDCASNVSNVYNGQGKSPLVVWFDYASNTFKFLSYDNYQNSGNTDATVTISGTPLKTTNWTHVLITLKVFYNTTISQWSKEFKVYLNGTVRGTLTRNRDRGSIPFPAAYTSIALSTGTVYDQEQLPILLGATNKFDNNLTSVSQNYNFKIHKFHMLNGYLPSDAEILSFFQQGRLAAIPMKEFFSA